MSSFSNGILTRDLARMAHEANDETKLIGRPMADPTSLSDAHYFLKHGMTRAQAAEMGRELRRQDFEVSVVADLNGEPPELCNTKGLSPKRARYANYFFWRQGIARELSALHSKKAALESMIEAPSKAEADRRGAVRRTADFLLGRVKDGDDNADPKKLADNLAVAQHRADAAREALPMLEKEIDRAQLRLDRLNEREQEFLHPAIIEIADAAGLGKLYLKKIAELRDIAGLIFGLSHTVGTYGNGFRIPNNMVEMPRAGLPSIKGADDSEYVIRQEGRADIWKSVAQSLRLDPRQNITVPVPK